MNAQGRRPQPGWAPPSSPPQGDWTPLLAQVRNERELLALCAEHLAALDPREIEDLPRDCRPVELEDRTDLAVYALTLVRRHNAAPSCPPLLASLAQFFALANVRMAQVLRHMHATREADAVLSRMGRSRPRDPGSQAIE